MTQRFTPDGRYFVVRGRLWRASNPGLPEDERQGLVSDLMSARRDVATALRNADKKAERTARARVHRAKVALGERGPVWWGDGASDFNRRLVRNTPYAEWYAKQKQWEKTILRMLSQREAGASICPSEVARAVQPDGWRSCMEDVRDAARNLARAGSVELKQKGRVVDPDSALRGPIRIALPH